PGALAANCRGAWRTAGVDQSHRGARMHGARHAATRTRVAATSEFQTPPIVFPIPTADLLFDLRGGRRCTSPKVSLPPAGRERIPSRADSCADHAIGSRPR